MERAPIRFPLQLFSAVLVAGLFSTLSSVMLAQQQWTEARASQWYQKQPLLLGANYLPSDADNELEMWQSETFNAAEIDKELGWGESLGMNTMRVFLHNLPWEEDSVGFKHRIDQFLALAAKHHIRPVFVLFDSCWDPAPKPGQQPEPRPGIHNSRWVQAPGKAVLADPQQYPRMQAYVEGVIGAFASDRRILAWDVWNEPDNDNASSYGKEELPNKLELIRALLPQVFAWARSVHPIQPLTSGVWTGDWSSLEKMSPIGQIQIQQSDIISFHNYDWPEGFEKRIIELQKFHRPMICTEYMARGAGSTFDTILPIAKKYRIGAINWGLVKGRSQTYLPWDSWQRPYVDEKPTVWFHDIFYEDGKPYREREVELMRSFVGKPTGSFE
jgi:hypothetical protein